MMPWGTPGPAPCGVKASLELGSPPQDLLGGGAVVQPQPCVPSGGSCVAVWAVPSLGGEGVPLLLPSCVFSWFLVTQ